MSSRAPARSNATLKPAATRVPSLVKSVLNSPGRPLDPNVRESMEPRFGYDFSRVRVHTDGRAAESARAVNARAYASGRHLVFNEGQYQPGTGTGRERIAHELTHVVQQSRGPVAGSAIGEGVHVNRTGDKFEREAARAAGGGSQAQTYAPLSPLSDAHAGSPSRHLQRLTPAQEERQTSSQEASAGAAQLSGVTSIFSALGSVASGVGGLISAHAAERQAGAAERQAEAAENPPVGTPTTGGIVVNNGTGHIDIPEVASSVTTGAGSETEDPFKLLAVSDGPRNLATFNVTLRRDGKSIKGGNTEDGESMGYVGGSTGSNLNVNLRAVRGAPAANHVATVRLLISGTNVGPRRENRVQRFSGGVKFDAAGHAEVQSSSASPGSVARGDGRGAPLLTILATPAPVPVPVPTPAPTGGGSGPRSGGATGHNPPR